MSAKKDWLMDPRQIAAYTYQLWQSEGALLQEAEVPLSVGQAEIAVVPPASGTPEPVRARASRSRKARGSARPGR